ncbi:serine hydrolase [Photorhabdus tasmaniensis]
MEFPLPKDVEFKYSLVYENYINGDTVKINENMQMPSSSVRKVFIMTAVMSYLIENKISVHDVIKVTPPNTTRNDISGCLQYLDMANGNISYHDLLHLMITYSDVLSTKYLGEIIGVEKLNQYCKKHGFYDTEHYYLVPPTQVHNIKKNMTTAADVSLFYKKLFYEHSNNNQSSFHKNLGLDFDYTVLARKILARQQFSDQLPEFLPDEYIVAHKHGWGVNNLGDAGVILKEDTFESQYSLVILIKDVNSTTYLNHEAMVIASLWISDVSLQIFKNNYKGRITERTILN